MRVFDRLGLGGKFAALSVAGLAVLAVALIALVVVQVGDAMERQAIQRQASNMAVAWDVLRSKGNDFSIKDGRLMAGDAVLNDNNEIVDHIQNLVGGVATVFMNDVRVATNIKKPDGSRSVGTKLAQGPVWQAVFVQHQSFQGMADILGRSYYTRYEPILDSSKNVIGVLFVGLARDDFMAVVNELVVHIVISSVLLTLVLGAIAFAVSKRSFKALSAIQAVLARSAEGDLSGKVPYLEKKDEIGRMAHAVQVFRDRLGEIEQLRADQARLEKDAALERKRVLMSMADAFEAKVMDIVRVVSSSSSELHTTAQSMSNSASQATVQASAVAAASEQATVNVQTVAAAAEELSQSVAEVSRRAVESARISAEASDDAARASEMVKGLADAAEHIGQIVQMINDIASQTNLLALNATIEAARAGEAGKGFAVVAGEVKSLANQTGRATDEITGQVVSIQNETRQMVDAIGGISSVIERVRTIATDINGAVEQQSQATHEIARNVQQAALGTQEVSENIGGVSQTAAVTRAASDHVVESADQLAANSEKLKDQVFAFLTEIRAS